MLAEQAIVDKLCDKFPSLQDRIFVQRSKRIFTSFMMRDEFEPIIRYVHDEMGFNKANHVVGTDEGEYLGFVYILSNIEGIILALKLKAPKSNPQIRTMTDVYPSLELHERELVNLFGAEVQGLIGVSSYPLPDNWPQGSYPMRKEWDPKYFDKHAMKYNPPSDEANKEVEGNE